MAEEAQLELDIAENETEVEVSAPPIDSKESEIEVVEKDQFQKAESATQKRIDRLTKKMREAERREAEAVNYAKQVHAESQQLKQRFNALDNSYVAEFSNRVTSEMAQAEKEYSHAMEIGDTAAQVEANKKLIALSAQNDRANQARHQQEQQKSVLNQEPAPQPAPQPQIRRPDVKAEEWAERNKWFGNDEARTFAAFGIHKKLVEDEGFDPTSDEYYIELDTRLSTAFNGEAKPSKRSAQTVAGVSRQTSGRSSGKKVRLTPSQVTIAKKLGVPLSEYAKYVKE
tara:strand:+ start:984 stop:1838 length:855 start_codon:yes stop_codon:yes gene_type:complete